MQDLGEPGCKVVKQIQQLFYIGKKLGSKICCRKYRVRWMAGQGYRRDVKGSRVMKERRETYNPPRAKRQDTMTFFDCGICSFQIECRGRTKRLKFVMILKAALARRNAFVFIQVPPATPSQYVWIGLHWIVDVMN
jgi:hypothetical protein